MQEGEFDFIRQIRKLVADSKKRTLIGIGDDAAVIRGRRKRVYLFTTDTLVEDVHFKWRFTTARQIGWRALAVNVSDIAAMGGCPAVALVTLGLPRGTSSSKIDEIYRGILDLSSRLDIEIAGGDIVRSPIFFITISLLGEAEADKVVLRKGAKPGDIIYVTGSIGSAATGLICLMRKDVPLRSEVRDFLEGKWLFPIPKVEEARQIATRNLSTAMIDISDGLSADLYHILEESEVGAELWMNKIPVDERTKEALPKLGKSFYDVVLEGGEDYELLFTSSADRDVEKSLDFPVCAIGKIVPDRLKLWLIDEKGEKREIFPRGWDHFLS